MYRTQSEPSPLFSINHAGHDTPTQNPTPRNDGTLPHYIAALLHNNGEARWNAGQPTGTPVVLSFNFMTEPPEGYPSAEEIGFQAMSEFQREAVRSALALWAEVANIEFIETDGDGDLSFGTAILGNVGGFAGFPGSDIAGDVWLDNTYPPANAPTVGTYGFSLILHEIGHALGLKHPGDYDDDTLPPYLPGHEDNNKYTLMAYAEHPYRGAYTPAAPLLYDIAAIQYLYGANTNTRSGDDVYSWDPAQRFISAIWDGGGTDTISAANQTLPARIDLRAGHFSSIGRRYSTTDLFGAIDNLAIAFGTVIENAIGSNGSDIISGNAIDNHLRGLFGNDVIDAGRGDDTLLGNQGTDLLAGGDGADWMDGGAGHDRLTGESDNDILVGGAGNDTLFGGFEDDRLIGGLGNDVLRGSFGDDLYRGGGGRDLFDLEWDMGVDVIVDFQDGRDRLRLIDGLRLRDISITQVGRDTHVELDDGTGAILRGISANLITRADFVLG